MEYIKVQNFFANPYISKIIKKYQDTEKKAEEDIGFNVFRIISDYYYRENFHGDILEAFWSYSNNEDCDGWKYPFLQLFIKMIKEIESQFDETYYQNGIKLDREVSIEGNRRIDFVIVNENKDHCIIIENKLYDAVDMYNQLPAYKKAMEKKYKVDTIVYMPLSEYKMPDSSTWEREIKVLIVPAKELIFKWLNPCIEYACNNGIDDIRVILKQYKSLLESLLSNPEIKNIMKELYDFLKSEQTNLNVICYLKELLDKYPQNMGEYIRDQILKDPMLRDYRLIACGWECGCFKIINDTIYLRCYLRDKDAFKVLMVVDDNFNESNIDKFNELVAKRPELKESQMDMEAQEYLEGAYRLVKTFDFNEMDMLLDYLKNLVNVICKTNK